MRRLLAYLAKELDLMLAALALGQLGSNEYNVYYVKSIAKTSQTSFHHSNSRDLLHRS